MIGTFPKSGFVVRKVDRAVFFYAPEPFAVVVIDKIVENILPRAVHHRKILRQSVTGKEPGERSEARRVGTERRCRWSPES